jgi:hypothetical protein
MKEYRLLRNNKESGPYSTGELIQMGLKAYDLVWIEGKSASWRYPSEIAELKPFAPVIEEQPFDRFYKKPVSTPVKAVEPASAVNMISQVDTVDSIPVKQAKPRIRIKADSTRIETPVTPVVFIEKEISKPPEPAPVQVQKEKLTQETKPVAEPAPDWKDVWLNWEHEKKAVSDASKIDAAATMRSVNKLHASSNNQYNGSVNSQYTSGVTNRHAAKGSQYAVVKGNEVLETKFSQSLDDIKEQYVEKVLNKGRNKKSPDSSVTAAILITAIIALGVWLSFKWSGKGGESMEKVVTTTPKSAGQMQNSEVKNDLSAQEKKSEPDAFSPAGQDNNEETQTAHVTTTSKLTTTTLQKKAADDIYHPSHNSKTQASKTYSKQQPEKSANDDNEIRDSYLLSPVNSNANSDALKTGVTDNATPSLKVKQDPQAAAIAKFRKGTPKIADYVSVDPSYSGSNNVKLRVQNISDIPVDLVMIDLQYYDANGRSQKGETVYVRNIAAGETITVPAPESNMAAKIGYKISMVSSEKNNLYLIAD